MDSVLCCGAELVNGTFGCLEVSSSSYCEGLIAGIASASATALKLRHSSPQALIDTDELLWDDDDNKLTWQEASWPWFYLPALTWLCIRVFAVPLGCIHRRMLLHSQSFRDFIVKYVGCAKAPNPKRPTFLVMLGVIQLVMSLASVGTFIWSSQCTHIHVWINNMERGISVFFAFHFLVMLMKNEFVVTTPFYEPFNLIDMLTVPQMLLGFRVGTLSLGFLRSYRALKTYERLEDLNRLGVIHFFSSASMTSRLVILTVLRFFGLVVFFAGSTFILEVLGDPSFLVEKLHDTPMGKLSFFTTFYWVIETISTVGYGDYAPKTIPGRMVTMLCMVSGVLFFAVETSKFVEIAALQMKGTGMFTKTSQPHVVIMGSGVQHADPGILIAFFAELYHPVKKAQWPATVALCATEEGVHAMHEFKDHYLPGESRALVTVLHGSAMMRSDLARCQVDQAEILYVLTDTSGSSGQDAEAQDKRSILLALSVRREYPSCPLRVLLLRAESRQQADAAGIKSQRVFALNEMRSMLFWQSARVLGWSTLVCNLSVTIGPSDVKVIREVPDEPKVSDNTVKSWRDGYAHGMMTRIFGFLPSERLIAQSFLNAAAIAYREFDVIIFAVQVDGQVRIAPFNLVDRISPTSVLFALAQKESELSSISAQTRDWREQFYENRFQMFAEVDKALLSSVQNLVSPLEDFAGGDVKLPTTPTTPAAFSSSSNQRATSGKAPSRDNINLSEPLLQEDRRSEDRERKLELRSPPPVSLRTVPNYSAVAFGSTVSRSNGRPSYPVSPVPGSGSPKSLFVAPRSSNGTPVSPENKAASTSAQSDSGKADYDTEGVLRTLAEQAMAIRKRHKRVPFVVFVEVDKELESIKRFLTESRSPWLPCRIPVIFICSSTPSRADIDAMGVVGDPSTGFIVGDPHRRDVLIAGGISEASVLVCPSIEHVVQLERNTSPQIEDLAMADADAIMLLQIIDSLGVSCPKLFELKQVSNVNLLPPRSVSKLKDTTVNLTKQLALANKPAKLTNQSRFRCCQVMSEFWQSLFKEGPNQKTFQTTLCGHPRFVAGSVFSPITAGAMLAHAFYVPGSMEVTSALVVPPSCDGGVDAKEIYIWQCHPREEMVGKSFREAFVSLLSDSDGPAMTIGMYRFLEREEELEEQDPPMGFVMTSPEPGTAMRDTDLLYVLAPAQWGAAAYRAGLIPNSDTDNFTSARSSPTCSPTHKQ